MASQLSLLIPSFPPESRREGGKEGRKALRGRTTKTIDDGGRWSEDFYGYVI